MPSLIIQEQNRPDREVELTDRAVIGRTKECSVLLEDAHLSRQHCVVFREGTDYFVQDLDTRNGTQVNGVAIKKQQLRDGDTVSIGLTKLTFRCEQPEAQSLSTIGGLDILETLGSGTSATVYRARHERLDRDFAVKVYPVVEGEDVEGWMRSAASAAALDHPNVARIHDLGAERGWKYIVMELVQGQSLAEQILSGKAIQPVECLKTISHVADAVACAHEQGLIHGNLRPSKIYLRPDGSVKVVDFGLPLAEVSGSGGKPSSKVDPVYLSPEQCMGYHAVAASDIYSLGAIFYRLVTGVPLFEADSQHSVIEKQMMDAPIPARQIVPTLPDSVAALLDKMLAKTATERLASGKELVAAMEPLLATPETRPAPARRKHKDQADEETGGSAAVALIMGFMLIVVLYAVLLGGRELGHQAVWVKQRLMDMIYGSRIEPDGR